MGWRRGGLEAKDSEGVSNLGKLKVGKGFPVRIAAAINLSPESFYKGSVATTPEQVAEMAARAIEEGAEILDIGAMSTAPYLETEVSEEVEKERVRSALRTIRSAVRRRSVISVDTVRASVAALALDEGAKVVNDVSGLKDDPRMAAVVAEADASLIAMAYSRGGARSGRPTDEVNRALKETLTMAARAGIDGGSIVVDPGIGFYRGEGAGRAFSLQKRMPWYEWDYEVIARLGRVVALGRPVCVGLSRKSSMGRFGRPGGPEERLPASLGATALAVFNGAKVVRTHDVAETVQAVRVAEAILRRRDP